VSRPTNPERRVAATHLEKRIGYRFRDSTLVAQALTHRSFGSPHNERLEFLGDGVLDCVIAEELFSRYPDLAEGKLTWLRASLVREESLVERARAIELGKFLRLSDAGAGLGADIKPSILADALEALFGAAFVDGGYAAAKTAILAVYSDTLEQLNAKRPTKDAKTRLQEYLQGRKLKLPEYRVAATKGAAHRQTFEVECLVPELKLAATGSGTSRQRAEQVAAEKLLAQLSG
jgi:ribonuclease-3